MSRTAITVSIEGVDQTALLVEGSVSIQGALNQRWSASLTLCDRAGSYAPEVGQNVVIGEGTGRAFTGLIDEIEESRVVNNSLGTELWLRIKCVDLMSRLDQRVCSEPQTYKGETCGSLAYIALANWAWAEGISFAPAASPGGFIEAGPTVEKYVFNKQTVLEALEDFAKLADKVFFVDVNGDFHFETAGASSAAPFAITATSANFSRISIAKSKSDGAGSAGSGYFNQSWTRTAWGAWETYVESFVGDGAATSWALSKLAALVVDIRVNGKSVDFGGEGENRDYTWYYGEATISQAAGAAVLAATDTLEVWYHSVDQGYIFVQDLPEIAARGAVESNSGQCARVFDDGQETNFTAATNKAQAALDLSKSIIGVVTLEANGFGPNPIFPRPGMVFSAALSYPAISGDFSIQEIAAQEEPGAGLRYTCRCVKKASSRRISNGVDYFRELAKKRRGDIVSGGSSAAATSLAPNISSATYAVTLERWSNTTVPVFSGTITLPGSLGTLAVIAVFVVLPSGKRVQIARYDSGFVAGGALSYSGYDPQVLQASTPQNVSLEFDCYNADFTPTPAPYTISPVTIPANSITSYTVTDDVASRWSMKGGTGALQAVTPNTISCSSYPQMLTFWSVSPQYGRLWHKWYEIDGPATIINIGGQGTDTAIFPPTVSTSEVVRFWAAVGAYGSEVDPTTVPGAVFYDVTVAGPAAPGTTDATAWYFTSATPTYAPGAGGASMFGWTISGKLPITASDNPDKFWAARLCLQTGKYVGGVWTPGGWHPATPDPTDPASIVGDYCGPTAWYAKEDHADNLSGDRATGIITWNNPNMWPVPSDGYDVHRFYLYVESRRSGGTWVAQNCWSAAAGTATPGVNAYQELTVDGTKSAVTAISIATSDGDVLISGSGVGVIAEKIISGVTHYGQLKYDGFAANDGTNTSSVGPTTASLSGGKFTLDANGRVPTYNNTALAGFGIPHIVWHSVATNQAGPSNQYIHVTPGGSVLPAGYYRVNIKLVCSVFDAANEASVAPSIGYKDPDASTYFGSGGSTYYQGGKVACGNPTAGPYVGLVAAAFPAIYVRVDGSVDLSVGFTVTGTWTSARYAYAITVERLA